MGKISAFNSFYEFFAGVNAAVLAIDKIADFVYHLHCSVCHYEIDTRCRKVLWPLSKIKSNLASPGHKEQFEIEIADVDQKIADYRRIQIRFQARLDKQVKNSIQVREQAVANATPLFVVCLLYCLMMIVFGGMSDSIDNSDPTLLCFLGYLNCILLTIYSFPIFRKFRKKAKLDENPKVQLSLNEKKTVQFSHASSKTFRSLVFFIACLALAGFFTALNYIIVLSFPNMGIIDLCWWLIIFISLTICASSVITIVHNSIQWRNKHLKVITFGLKKMLELQSESYPSNWDTYYMHITGRPLMQKKAKSTWPSWLLKVRVWVGEKFEYISSGGR